MSQSIPVLVSATYAISVDEPGTTGNPAPTLSYAWTYTPQGGSAASLGTTRQITASFGPGVGRPLPGTLAVAVTATNTFGTTPLTASATLTEFVPLPILQQVRIRDNATPAAVISAVPNESGDTAIGVALLAGGPNAGDFMPVSQFATGGLAYQWRRDGVPIAGATNILYTIVADDIDTLLSVVVTATNAIGSAQQTAFVAVGDVPDAGFTDLTQFLAEDSRIVYVAANGNDTAADAVYDRGYYLPDDPEIGDDPTQPAGSVQAFATYAAALARLRINQNRINNPTAPRFPEWLLFRRGDAFNIGTAHLTNTWSTGGRSESERRVVAAYGAPSLPRPVIIVSSEAFISAGDGADYHRGGDNWAFASLDVRSAGGSLRGIRQLGQPTNFLFEDIRFASRGSNVVRGGNVVFRRCVMDGNFNTGSGHVQGIFMSSPTGANVIEECVFDMNGYKEDPFDPSTWTFGVSPDTGPRAGGGVQPSRNTFCRNLYLSRYTSLYLRGNIIARGASGSVQMRVGGIAERNVLLFDQNALQVGIDLSTRSLLQDAVVRQNLHLHDDHFVAPPAIGVGFTLRMGEGKIGICEDNIVAHYHRQGSSSRLFAGSGIPARSSDPQQYPAMQALHISMHANVGVNEFFAPNLSLVSPTSESGVLSASVGENAIVTLSGDSSRVSDSVRPAEFEFGTVASGGNDYFAPQWNFASWQARGYDPESTRHATIESLATVKGWMTTPDAQGRRGWERDIVSYMQSIDPTYVPDEQITVDHGVPVDRRRPNAPRIWEVLSDPAEHPSGVSWQQRVMTEAQAKLTARRYHAFLVFIERAKQNRKGAWDPRYTADALNNYIREGFGKAPVGGPYTADYPEGSAA